MADSMLIDGLIKFCDEKSKNIKLKAEPQVFIEITQALEELKALKKEVELYRNLDKTNFSDGYNKAIDEFAEALKADVMAITFGLNCRDVDRIAKELKTGDT